MCNVNGREIVVAAILRAALKSDSVEDVKAYVRDALSMLERGELSTTNA